MSTRTKERPDVDQINSTQSESWIVIVYNNEHNTYDEVMMILMVATHCNEEEAYIETWEIDHLGKSVVHVAGQEECETVASVIRQIGIQVEVISE
jgi:ATP-dependent Clp protease adapter protein ClpS